MSPFGKRFRSVFLFLFAAIVISAEGAEDVCKLPKDAGRCRSAKPMFHFNFETKRCEGFLYKGCAGNGNKFQTLEECHEACQQHIGDPEEVDVSIHLRGPHCLDPPVSDTGSTCYAYIPRFTFNPDTLQCEPYVYGGCLATSNLFMSDEECRTSCFFGEVTIDQQQQQQQATTPARTTPAPTQRPGKKPKSKTTTTTPSPIEEDETSSDSEISLSPTLPKDENRTDICLLPPVHPHLIACTSFVEKWTFDARQGNCIEFIYGGCFGTQNLFDSAKACRAKCGESRPPSFKTVEVCGLEVNKGPCKKFQLKFGFNRETNRCEKFAYGGCEGNNNRFDTLEECVDTCGGHEPEENLVCSVAKCDANEAAFHRAKGCQPIVQKGECCPSSWDCSAWEERLRRWDECFWTDEREPRGRYYAIGDSVPEASDEGSCRATCKCVEGTDGEAQINCTTAECTWPGMERQGVNCHKLYQVQSLS